MADLSLEVRVDEEIRRLIAAAVADGSIVSVSSFAEEVLRLHPDCAMTREQLMNKVMLAAIAAGVAIEIG